MAIYHCSVKTISRSNGSSSVASASYRSGEKIRDEKTGLVHDFTKKKGIETNFILSPELKGEGAEIVKSRANLWNAVEFSEKRKDAQLAREMTVALPVELTQSERADLVRDFAKTAFVQKGMVADIAIHAPSREGDERNHHAHIMLTMREITDDGFGKKNRDWNSKEQLEDWRKDWEKAANKALEKAGHQERIDSRSLKDQGKNQAPTIHLGVSASNLERKAKREARQQQREYEPVTERAQINAEIKEKNSLAQRMKEQGKEILNKLKEMQRAQAWWGMFRKQTENAKKAEKAKQQAEAERKERRAKLQELQRQQEEKAAAERAAERMAKQNTADFLDRKKNTTEAEKKKQWESRPKDWSPKHEALEKKFFFTGALTEQETLSLKANRQVYNERNARLEKRSRNNGFER